MDRPGRGTSKARRRPGRRWRTVFRWAFRAGMLALILALFVLIVFPSITDSAPVRHMVARRLSGALGGARVTIESLRVAPLRPQVLRLRGLSVAPPGPEESGAVLSFASLDCHYRPAGLLRGRLDVTGVAADGLQLRLRRTGGRWNLAFPSAGARPRPARRAPLRLPLAVRIAALRFTGVHLAVHTDSPRASFALNDLRLSASGRFGRDLRGTARFSIRSGPLAASVDGGGAELPDGLALRGELRSDGAELRLRCAAAAEGLRASADRVGTLPPFDLTGGLEARLDMRRMDAARAELCIQVPGLLGDVLTASMERGEDWHLSGRNVLSLELGELQTMLAAARLGPLALAGLSGVLTAVTDLDGSFSGRPGLSAYLDLSNRVSAHGLMVEAGLDLAAPAAGTARPSVTGSVSGLRAELSQQTALALSGGAGGLAVASLDLRADSAAADLGRAFAVHAQDARARLDALGALPRLARARLGGGFSASRWTARGRGFEGMSGSADVRFSASLRDALAPGRSTVVIEDASGSIGPIVPAFGLSGRVEGLGREGLALGGRGALDASALAGLLDSLPPRLRSAIGHLGAQGGLAAAFELGGTLPPSLGGLALAADGSAALRGVSFRRNGLGASVADSAVCWSAAGAVGAGYVPDYVQLALEGSAGRLAVRRSGGDGAADGTSVQSEAVRFEFDGGVSDPAFSSVDGRVSVSVRAAQAELPGSGKPAPVSFELAGTIRANPLAGDLQLADVRFQVPDLAALAVPRFALAGFAGDSVEGRAELSVSDLAGLFRLAAGALPEPVVKRLPAVEGELDADVKLAGRAPLVRRFVAAIETGTALQGIELLPLSAFWERKAPLDVDLKFTLRQAAVAKQVRPGLTASGEGLEARCEAHMRNGDLDGRAELTVARVHASPLEEPIGPLSACAGFSLENFDTLLIRGAELSGFAGAVSVEGDGEVRGLSRLTRPPSPAELLSTLSVTARLRGGIRADLLGAIPGLKAAGSLAWDACVELAGGRSLAVRLAPRAEGLSVAYGDLFAVEGVEGGFEFSKRWRVLTARELALGRARLSRQVVETPAGGHAPRPGALLPEFATAEASLVPSGRELRVSAVSLAGRRLVGGVKVVLAAEGGSFAVPRLQATVLGGLLTGVASFARAEGGRAVEARGEFSGLDLRYLLPARLRGFRGDSQIDGNLTLHALLSGSARAPVKDVSAQLNATHIGPTALDRLLLSLDPEGVNPSIVRTRRALAFGKPRRASASLRHGFLAIEADLEGLAGGLVTRYSVPGFNVAELFRHERVVRLMRMLAPAMAGLDRLDATTIVTSPDGSVTMQ